MMTLTVPNDRLTDPTVAQAATYLANLLVGDPSEPPPVLVENAALRAALAPFVRFIEAWDAAETYGAHDRFLAFHTTAEADASLKLSDFRAAREAVRKMEG